MQIGLQLENTDKWFSGDRTVDLDGQEEITKKGYRETFGGGGILIDLFIILVMMVSHL